MNSLRFIQGPKCDATLFYPLCFRERDGKEAMGSPKVREGKACVWFTTAHMRMCQDLNPHLLGFHVASHWDPCPLRVQGRWCRREAICLGLCWCWWTWRGRLTSPHPLCGHLENKKGMEDRYELASSGMAETRLNESLWSPAQDIWLRDVPISPWIKEVCFYRPRLLR